MKQQYLPGLEPTRKPDALPPKTKTVQKLNNGGTVDTSSLNQLIKKTEKEISKRPEDQPGYNYEKDPNLLRRLKYIAKTFDDNDLGDSLDSAIDKEDIELKKLGRDPKTMLQMPRPYNQYDKKTYPSNPKQKRLGETWDALVQDAKNNPNDPNSKDTKKMLLKQYNSNQKKYLNDDELKLIGKHKSQLPKPPEVKIPDVVLEPSYFMPEKDPLSMQLEKQFNEMLRKSREDRQPKGIAYLLGVEDE